MIWLNRYKSTKSLSFHSIEKYPGYLHKSVLLTGHRTQRS
uniref:Uncharacterized protein n=1 Tax=Anguilla anguilla TaxID=7936 RepID=A0A0E9SFX5_ANGAN